MNNSKTIIVIMMVALCSMTCKPAADKKKNLDDDGYVEIISDLKFDRGLWMTSSNKADPDFLYARLLDFGSGATGQDTPWRIFQWANYKHSLRNVPEVREGDKFIYESESTNVTVDRSTGAFSLRIKAQNEYSSPREYFADWPTIYFDQTLVRMPVVGELDELIMEIEFVINRCDNFMEPEEYNPEELHTAQFMWYVTVINQDASHGALNDYLWFGLMFYDYREEWTSTTKLQDYGKEDATGQYIYNVGMKDILDKPFAIGQKVKIAVNVLPIIKTAIAYAQSQGFLKECLAELMKVNYMNIGLELPGTFDLDVEICKIGLKAKYKQ